MLENRLLLCAIWAEECDHYLTLLLYLWYHVSVLGKKVSTGFIYVHYMTDYDLSNWSWNACRLFHSGIFCTIPKVFDQWQCKIVHIPGRQKDNPCRAGPGSFRTNYVNGMAEDGLAPSVARSSSAMVLTMCDRQTAVFLEEGFWLHVPFHTNMHLCFLKKTSR